MENTAAVFFVSAFMLLNLFPNHNAQGQSTDSTNQLKILTLNFNAETDNQTLMVNRLGILENYITQNNIDVIFIQECWHMHDKSAATLIAEDLNMDAIYHMEDGVSGIRVTSVCMVTNKNLQLRNPVYFKLPHSAPTIGDGQKTWVSLGESNILIGATVTLGNGRTAFLWTAHLTDGSNSNRLDQVKYAEAQMEKAVKDAGQDWNQALTFFGGDFNTTPDTAEMEYLRTSLQFQDMWLFAHPDDEGRTFVGVPTDPEYNPMSHAAGLFPSQAGYQETGRFDYLYIHSPAGYSAGLTRVFTSPVDGHTWMSDHYGVVGEINFAGAPVTGFPAADSDMSALGSPTLYKLTDDALKNLPVHQDFEVTSPRGFTLTDGPSVEMFFSFTDGKPAIYPVSYATLGAGDIISFAFFSCGNYGYDLTVADYRDHDGVVDYSGTPKIKEMTGTIQVR